MHTDTRYTSWLVSIMCAHLATVPRATGLLSGALHVSPSEVHADAVGEDVLQSVSGLDATAACQALGHTKHFVVVVVDILIVVFWSVAVYGKGGGCREMLASSAVLQNCVVHN